MRKFFQYINRQSKTARDNYAFGIAATFTALVLTVWLVARLGGETIIANSVSANDTSSPFSTLIKETKEKLSEARSSFSQTEQGSENNNSQAATALNSSTASPEGLILSEENIEMARQALEESTSSEDYLIDKSIFTEVMIATSSASTTTLPACTDIVINSASSGIGVSCLESVKTASSSAQ